MLRTWQLQEAKNKFSQVVKEAVTAGPQIVTKRGEQVVVVLSMEAYRQLTASRKKFSAFFMESPLVGLALDLARDQSEAREAFEL